MKSLFIPLALALFFMATATAQNVGIGTTTPNANAALEIKSNNKGLLMPRLSTTARNNMTNVAKGMLVYDTTNAGFYYHDGGKWLPISQLNSDSLLRYTYPGVAPTITSMPFTDITTYTGDLYGTLYDNGGASGNYTNNSLGDFGIYSLDDNTLFIKVVVEEMNIESPYDSLEIYSDNDYEHKQLFTGNRIGTFYFTGNRELKFRFRSNGVNNLSGFKINWVKVTSNLQALQTPPISGWYFNAAKLAARGGVNINNNWATDSLGMFSLAFGQNALAKGNHSITLGRNSYSLNDNSIAIGGYNRLTGTYNNAFGTYNELNGFSCTAIGTSNKSNSYFTTTIGTDLIAESQYSIVMGKYNSPGAPYRIFEIGNGTANTDRSNALTILENGNTGIGTTAPTTTLEVNGGIKTKYSGSVIKSVTGTGSAAFVNLSIPALPADWDFTNTLVMVSAADGVSGIIYQTKLTSTTNIELFFEANATGVTRFNYIVFKL